MTVAMKDPGNCYDYELLISKACDDECTPEETEVLKRHLEACGECRNALSEYRELRDMMTTHLVTLSCPPAPATKERKHPVLRLLTGRTARRYAGQAAAIAASILFFVLGHHMGFAQANRQIPEMLPSTAVATPSMWVANRPANPAALANVESEQPFTESIGRYRAAVGMELRQSKVDWLRVRELVEAMGELRTDLELLTLHMAFLDIRTGSSPSEVAEHWEGLGTSSAGRTVFKP